MATLIPSRNTCLPRMTPGERRLAHRLEDLLEDDYLVWYDVPVGPRQRQPDFVVLHPQRGLLILEVKDWKLDTVHSMDRSSAVLVTQRGHVTVPNPLSQARMYALELSVALERDPALRYPEGHPRGGKLLVPWAFGVVLTRITREQFDRHELGNVLPPHQVICQDEMQEPGASELSAASEAFQERLWAMFTVELRAPLTLPKIDRIRWHVFPEVRVSSPVQPSLLDDQSLVPDTPAIPDLIRVMDLQQEQLARSLGEGHRVIHGVAGSGKTMILGYRCLHLARTLHKPILVLCFNRTLAARLEQLMAARDVADKVAVRSFHAWCFDILRTYNLPKPLEEGGSQFYAQLVQAVIDGVERRAIPAGQYGAVLVDEGHDFEPDWLRLITRMVDPDTNALLLLYDDAQSIYGQGKRRRFSFASVGIQAKGRTTILRLNYRNTYEILALARRFAGDLLADEAGDEDAPHVIAPESAGRHGPEPEVIDCQSAAEEARVIAERISKAIGRGEDPNQIAVIYRDNSQGRQIESELRRRQVPVRAALNSTGKKALFTGAPAVKLVSIYSSKGLEFDSVFLPGIGRPVPASSDAVTEARLLYVAMTRAMNRLTLTRSHLGGTSRGDAAMFGSGVAPS